jgi:thiol-disulfide isomerase/thioredoxin
MSRKLILFLLATTAFTACRNNVVEINGKLENPGQGEYIFLEELKSNELLTVDSIMISDDGSFYFKREVNFPSFYLLKINENNFLTMLLEPGEEIKLSSVHDSLNFPSLITGSEGTKLLVDYNKELRRVISKLSSLSDIYNENIGSPGLPAVIDSLDSLAQNHLNEINLYTRKYIDDNITSLVSLMALYQQVSPNVYVLDPSKDLSYFLKVDSSLYARYPEYDQVQILHNQVKEFLTKFENQSQVSVENGEKMIAPEISLPSPEGDTIRLSSTRGSVVLLDFWASWCPPCRMESPNLVYVYKMYHKKGFQIYQVSLDKTKEAWLKGIKEDHLEQWIHVSDVQYWNSVVVPMYKIESIPANYLIDKDGRIIASNLRGDALQRKLAELFK